MVFHTQRIRIEGVEEQNLRDNITTWQKRNKK